MACKVLGKVSSIPSHVSVDSPLLFNQNLIYHISLTTSFNFVYSNHFSASSVSSSVIFSHATPYSQNNLPLHVEAFPSFMGTLQVTIVSSINEVKRRFGLLIL